MADTPEQIAAGLDPANIQVNAPSSKNAMGVKGSISLDPTQTASILENMQQMIDQRAGAQNLIFSGPNYNTAMSGLKDATAWGSGGVQGPTQALAVRDEQKSKEAKELFDMRTQMASYKAAQAQAAAANKSMDSLLAGGGANIGSGPGLVGAEIMSEVQRLRGLGRTEEAQKYYQDALKEASKIQTGFRFNPQAYDQRVKIVLPDGTFELVDARTAEKFQNAGLAKIAPDQPQAAASPENSAISKDPILRQIAGVESGYKNIPQSTGASNAYGLYQIVPKTFETVKNQNSELKDVTWEQFKSDPKIQTYVAEKLKASNSQSLQKAGLPETPLNHYTMWFSGDTKLASAPADAPISSIMSADQIKANPTIAGKTAGQIRAMFENRLNSAGTTGKTMAVANTTAPQTTAARITIPEAEAKLRATEAGLSEELKKTGQVFSGYKAATISARDTAESRLASSEYLNGLLKSNPRAFGALQHHTVLAGLASALEEGISAGPTGTIGLKGMDVLVRKAMPGASQPDIDAAQKATRQFALMQLQEAKTLLAGQGAVSDAERTLVKDLTGSIKNSPAALRDMLRWGTLRADYDLRVGDLHEAFERKKPNASYREFMLTPEYQTARREHERQIREFGRSTDEKQQQAGGAKPTFSGTTSGGLKWKVV